MSSSRSGAEILVETLIASGISTIFGVPGDTGVVLYDALHGRQSEIEHVLANDERGAAFMADAYARLTNRVGVVEVSSGGGATFVVGGLGEPLAASVPLLLLSSDIQSGSQGTGALTESDQLALFGGVTKWAARVTHAAEIPELVGEALSQALSGRPGPAALVIPEEVFDETAAPAVAAFGSTLPASRPQAPPAAVAAAAELIASARRPALVAGSGVHLSSAWEALAELAEQAALPVATTIHGKGAIDEGSEWSLGVIGANGARDYANEYLAEADVVVFVGTRANSTDTNGFTSPPRTARTVQIDIDVERAGRNYPGCLAIVADARAALQALSSAAVRPDESERSRRRELLAGWRQAWSAAPAGSDSWPVHPVAVVRAVRALVDDHVSVVGDAGTPTPYLACYWEASPAARSVIVPRGHGPMGYALPAAIGAAHANPGRQVVAFTTDGSLLMACGALETVHRQHLPVLYIHFNNHSMGWIKTIQHYYFDGRYFGVDLEDFDAVGVAASFGLHASRADNLDQLVEQVRAGLDSRQPTFIDVRIPVEYDLHPPVAPWLEAVQSGAPQRPIY